MMAFMKKMDEEAICDTREWGEQTRKAGTDIFTGERTGLIPGWWAMLEDPLKRE